MKTFEEKTKKGIIFIPSNSKLRKNIEYLQKIALDNKDIISIIFE